MFLKQIAHDLYEQLDGNFENVTVIFPNKRASLFFNQYLGECSSRPLWAPEYMTITELFESYNQLTIADSILTICYLYNAYIKVTNRTETLDQFYSWGEIMLGDFQDIDNNMADAAKLFRNIEELDELTDYSFMSEAQVEAIRSFFSNFDINNRTELKSRFLSIWNFMLPIYNELRTSLLADGYAYEGMMKRMVVEKLQDGIAPDASDSDRMYVVAGFNVLNETEKRMFDYLRRTFKTLFFWDRLPDDDADLNFEANRFINANISHFGNALKYNQEAYLSKPEINVISAPTNNIQARYVNQWASQHIDANTPLNRTAIILCDETLLQPVLHSLPSFIPGSDSEPIRLNVTMGYPISQTIICSLINAMLDLQIYGQADSNRWKFRFVTAVVNHPLTQLYIGEEAQKASNQIKNEKKMFPDDKFFAAYPKLKRLFVHCTTTNEILSYLAETLQEIGHYYANERKDDVINIESVFHASLMINRLKRIAETEMLRVEPITLARLLRQLLQSQAIPFHGEPAVGLQIMGLLESRNLDFDNILLLSANDEKMPKGNKRSSFIPFALREAYGMTTNDKQISLYAYNFYRMLQRTHHITMVYNNSSDGQTQGEMSRFILQMRIENTDTPMNFLSLTANGRSAVPAVITIEKSADIMKKLDSINYLSPSALNCYIDCPLKFFFRYIGGLREEDELTDEVDNALFGSIFHEAMEFIYRDLSGGNPKRVITASMLTELAKDKARIARYVDQSFAKNYWKDPEGRFDHTYQGEVQLNFAVICRYVSNQLRHDALLAPLRIIGVESKYKCKMEIPDLNRSVEMGGIIDRVDIVTINGKEQLRIVDYKTSSSEQNSKGINLEKLFIGGDGRAYHVLQALYYCDVLTTSGATIENGSNAVDFRNLPPIAPALTYVKKTMSGDEGKIKDDLIKIGEDKVYETITDYKSDCKADFHKLLIAKVSEIFNPDIPFLQSTDGHSCKYCQFTSICGKTVKPSD